MNVKPHPRGVELGQLIAMLSNTESRTLLQFLENDFSRVGRKTARRIIKEADQNLTERSYPKRIAHQQSQALYRAIQTVPVSAPRTDCIVSHRRRAACRRVAPGDRCAASFTVTTRPPAVYRGNPFQIEVGLAYGQAAGTHLELDEHGHIHKTTRQRRNRDAGTRAAGRRACVSPAVCESSAAALRPGRVRHHQSRRANELATPTASSNRKAPCLCGPLVILVHMASVWVPYTSEAKEAIASYPEIVKEIRLGLQQMRPAAGRIPAPRDTRPATNSTSGHTWRNTCPHIGLALQQILELSDDERERMIDRLDNASARETEPVMANKNPKRRRRRFPRGRTWMPEPSRSSTALPASVRETIARGELPTIDILVRGLSNVSYDPEKGYLELGDTHKSRTLTVNTIRSFAQTLRLMATSREMVRSNDFATKREAYYVSKNWGDCRFDDQPESDAIMDDIEALASAARIVARAVALLRRFAWRLGRRGTGRDRSSSGERRRALKLTVAISVPAPTAFPRSVEHLGFRTNAEFVLAIETGGMFQRLNNHQFWKKANCILVEMAGVPTRATRRFLRRLTDADGLAGLLFCRLRPLRVRQYLSDAQGRFGQCGAHQSVLLRAAGALPGRHAARYRGITGSKTPRIR